MEGFGGGDEREEGVVEVVGIGLQGGVDFFGGVVAGVSQKNLFEPIEELVCGCWLEFSGCC